MRDLFHNVDDVSMEHPKAEKVGSWRQHWSFFLHLRNVILGDDIIHVVGWDVVLSY